MWNHYGKWGMTELEASLKQISAHIYANTKCSLFELIYGSRERKVCVCEFASHSFSGDM